MPVAARDTLAVAQRLLDSLVSFGLALEGPVGESVPFDPNRHTPLSAHAVPETGQPVVIRFPAASYRGELIHKAGVTPLEEETHAG